MDVYDPPDADRWNHNIHYHRVLLGAAPRYVDLALDVGCGEGQLTRRLAEHADHVVGIDPHGPSIEAARRQVGRRSVQYVVGDVLSHPFVPGSFDLVTSLTTVHQMDARSALTRLRHLVRPGGVLAVVGVARSSPVEWPLHLAGTAVHQVLVRRHGEWAHPSPVVWPPPEDYRTMHRLAAEILPGSRFRRHLMWRYSIVWTKPAQ